MKTLNQATKQALEYLSARNPLTTIWNDDEYKMQLDKYIENKGQSALQALAGFYSWCDANIEDLEKKMNAIKMTFAHDLSGSKDKFMLPRSSSYKKFWTQHIKIKQRHSNGVI